MYHFYNKAGRVLRRNFWFSWRKLEVIKEYKYLGEWYNEEYNHKKSIQVRENKAMGMIPEIKHYGDTYKVGNMAPQVRMEIFQSTVIPTIFHEGWSKISKKDIERVRLLAKIVTSSLTSIENPIFQPFRYLKRIGLIQNRP